MRWIRDAVLYIVCVCKYVQRTRKLMHSLWKYLLNGLFVAYLCQFAALASSEPKRLRRNLSLGSKRPILIIMSDYLIWVQIKTQINNSFHFFCGIIIFPIYNVTLMLCWINNIDNLVIFPPFELTTLCLQCWFGVRDVGGWWRGQRFERRRAQKRWNARNLLSKKKNLSLTPTKQGLL